MKNCKHKNLEHIPQEDNINVAEDLICLDCGESVLDWYERKYNE